MHRLRLLCCLLLQVRSMHNVLGGVIDAHASYLLLRGMKTLGLRVAHQNRCACSSTGALQQGSENSTARLQQPQQQQGRGVTKSAVAMQASQHAAMQERPACRQGTIAW